MLKRTLSGKEEYLGIEGRRWLLALVEDELRRWWGIKPYHLRMAGGQSTLDSEEIAVAITQYGDIPAYGGFSDYAAARIEHALHEYAQLTAVLIWRDEGGRHGLNEFSPSYRVSPLNDPLRSLHLNVLTQGDVKFAGVGRQGDLVVRWFDSPLSFLTDLPTRRNLTVSAFAEGLSHLFATDASALTFTRIIAQWQNTMRPWRRLVLIGLFSASAACFVWFVIQQLKILLPILT